MKSSSLVSWLAFHASVFQISAKLREYAGLDHDVTIIGSRSFAEIWNTEAWNANQETSDEDFTAAMEDLDF